MATLSVRKLAAGSNQVGGLTTSRYEKNSVAFGVIPAASYNLGDTISFDDINSQQIISANIVLQTGSPVTLQVIPGTNLSSALQLATTQKADISYVVHYIRGNGRVGADPSNDGQGQLLQVTVGSAS
jgi:hypothetical protein